MSTHLTTEEIATSLDTDALWTALLAAKRDDDHTLVRAIENRMRELSTERRFAHLSNAELDRQIAGLRAGRMGDDAEMIAHSPAGGSGGGGNDDGRFLSQINGDIRANQAAGMGRTLGALLDERERRAPKA